MKFQGVLQVVPAKPNRLFATFAVHGKREAGRGVLRFINPVVTPVQLAFCAVLTWNVASTCVILQARRGRHALSFVKT
jgi:hypothetical protein